VRTPDGHDLDKLGPELATEIGRRSVMTSTTVELTIGQPIFLEQ